MSQSSSPGTNTGGGAIFYASVMRSYNENALVLTIDPKKIEDDWAGAVNHDCKSCVDVRCTEIWHSKNIHFIQGFSYEDKVMNEVREIVEGRHELWKGREVC
jgi:cephalosporin hydroxylase